MAVELKDRVNAGILFVSHNLGVIARVADRVAVMYAGEIVEEAPVRELFKNPRHPYTVGLLSCVPQPPGDDGVVAMIGWRLMAVKAAPCKAVRVCLIAANPHASEACLRPSGRFPSIFNQSMPQLTFEDTLGISAIKPVSTKPAF